MGRPAAGGPIQVDSLAGKVVVSVRIGCLPLTDGTPINMAAQRGFDRKYGIGIAQERQASW